MVSVNDLVFQTGGGGCVAPFMILIENLRWGNVLASFYEVR